MDTPSPPADAAALEAARRETLRAALDLLVPASREHRMPGAGALPSLLTRMLQVVLAAAPLASELDRLQGDAMARHGASFAALHEAAARALLDEMRERSPDAARQLALETVTCYYQQDEVLQALGLEARPPYPKGYRVEHGDLSLLEPVIARGRIYRDAD